MVKEIKQEEKTKTKSNILKKDYILTVGRRRQAVARVRLYVNPKEDVVWDDQKVAKGEIAVNGMPIANYFSGQVAKSFYEEPFKITHTEGKFIVTVSVSGGGKSGQLDAVVHGISRALVAHDKDEFRSLLKKKGLLSRDPRAKERRKVGTGGKARRKKQSPKR